MIDLSLDRKCWIWKTDDKNVFDVFDRNFNFHFVLKNSNDASV